MRKIARTDSNHEAITKALRQIGAKVCSLAQMGDGIPDLLVGYRGVNVLLEVKDGEKIPSKRLLTSAEKAWHETWPGQVCIAESVEDAVVKVIRAVGL